MDFPPDFRLILASQSPRRHSLLRDVGVPLTVVPSRAEEMLTGRDAVSLATLNAVAKVKGAELPSGLQPGAFVLGTDTIVTVDGKALGKPASSQEAADMLRRLSGRSHQVVSGVALARTIVPEPSTGWVGVVSVLGEPRVGHAVTDVTFLALSEADIDAYVARGEWKGKAGAYAIQGIAALFASEVRGEYSNVVGLPLCLLTRLFREEGFDLLLGRWSRRRG
jgi:septum formation protein